MSAPPIHPPSKRWSWRSQAFRALVYQVLAVAVIALLVLFLAHNTATNMRQRGMQSGFGFCWEPPALISARVFSLLIPVNPIYRPIWSA